MATETLSVVTDFSFWFHNKERKTKDNTFMIRDDHEHQCKANQECEKSICCDT